MAAIDQKEPADPGESLRAALFQALSEVAAALDAPSLTSGQVHLARRAAKRVHSLTRLAPERLATLARATRLGASRARRSFGATRDADVRAATIRSLRKHLPADARAALLTAASSASAVPVGSRRSALRAEIDALLRDWRLCDPQTGLADMLDAAGRAYRRSRRRMKRAHSARARDLHKWRAAVVDDEYLSRFLQPFVPDLRGSALRADRLRGLLGKVHDIDALSEWFDDRDDDSGATKRTLRRLHAASARKRAKLIARALDLGAALYDARPAEWRARVGRSLDRLS